MEEETQIKYFLMGNIKKDLFIYEFVNTNSAQTIFEAKQIFKKFVEEKRIYSEKIKIHSKNKYFYILIGDNSNFYLIYVENIITMGHSFEILEKIDNYYKYNILENENNIDLIRELTPDENREISNILTNYEMKYRKKIERKNKISIRQKSSKSETTKPTTMPESLRSGILKRKNDIKNEEIKEDNNNNNNDNLNINNNNIPNNNKNIDIIIEDDTPKEEKNDELLKLKNKKNTSGTDKQVKFDLETPKVNQERAEQLINDLTDENNNTLSFITDNSILNRNKVISLVFLILIVLIVIAAFIYILLTTDSV